MTPSKNSYIFLSEQMKNNLVLNVIQNLVFSHTNGPQLLNPSAALTIIELVNYFSQTYMYTHCSDLQLLVAILFALYTVALHIVTVSK